MESNTSTHLGKEIEKVVESYGAVPLMNQDNKNMLEKVKKQKTNEEVVQTLLTDPKSGHCMSYAESRMRFG
jgi:hypothetical protein